MSKNRGSHKGRRNYGKYNSKPSVGDRAREVIQNIDDNNPVIKLFQQYRSELDDKHERYERIVKLCRDITIESKRIIFLLHSAYTDIESKKKSILDEANLRLQNLINNNFKTIAFELNGHDPYLYHRAYTGGIQEFIEALCFYEFLKTDNINSWDSINTLFCYQHEINETAAESSNLEKISLLFQQYDYIFGIADFTGELMRKCINTLGSGNVNECFKLCNYVKIINTGFLGLVVPGNREFNRKSYTLRQSLQKMELVCYNIHVRGSEIPKHMLLNVIESSDVSSNEDEGFY